MNATETLQAISDALWAKLTDPKEHLLYRRALDRWQYPKFRQRCNATPEEMDAALEALYAPLKNCSSQPIDFSAVVMKPAPNIETDDERFAHTLSELRAGRLSAVNNFFFSKFPHLKN